MRAWVLALVLCGATAAVAVAQENPPPVTLPNGKTWTYDAEQGREIMRTCAACHGEFGEGGGGGVYPRISGMHPEYLAEQLRAFKSRARENIPMIPYANERELPEKDVLDVSYYLAGIKPPKHPPSDDTPMDAFERLKLAKQAVQMFGPAQYAVAKAVQDSVAEGIIPADEADDVFICVGVFIHWEASDDAKIQDYNYRATKEAIQRAVGGTPTAAEATERRNSVQHPFGAPS